MEGMKAGDVRQFLLLFDAYFPDLYRYVARRVGTGESANEIVRLTFLDGLGQIKNTPLDTGYGIWLYSLARPRVWEKMGKDSFPQTLGLIAKLPEEGVKDQQAELVDKFDKMLGKLSLEEREILRLKFFEEVSDGDVMTILSIEESAIGTKIYRVLKRAHFLLFGESDEAQGVYFGELSGFLSRIRGLENIVIPEAFKLTLKTDISMRIDKREMAVESEVVAEGPKVPPPFSEKAKGSDDPAKIFVEAVKEMKQEQQMAKLEEQLRLERQERAFDFIDSYKYILTLIPAVIFVAVVVFVVWKLDFFNGFFDDIFNRKIARGYPTVCSVEVVFEGEFADGEKRSLNSSVSDRICDYFEVSSLMIAKNAEKDVKVAVDVVDWFLEYRFIERPKGWRINEYKRTADSNEKSGKVLRNSANISRFAS